MKKKFCMFLSAATLLVTLNVYAQIDFYPNESGTIVKDGYTYRYGYDLLTIVKELYNNETSYYGDDQIDSKNEKVSKYNNPGKQIESSNLTMQQVFNVVSSQFTEDQKDGINSGDLNKLQISITINPVNGKVADVIFILSSGSYFFYIPVEVYRDIELALKSQLVFNITPIGKTLNYIMTGWSQMIE